MKSFAILILIVFFCLSSVAAAEVTLSTPQREYYILAGEEAVIPLTIESTYNHDVTGTLKQVMTPVNSGTTGPGSIGTSMQSRTFSAFTEKRTVPLPVGKSDTPADYLLTITFSYQEDGMRISTLGGIAVHFVASMEEAVPANQKTVAGMDMADPAAGTSPAGSAPAEKQGATSPAAALQNNQMTQDTTALRNQMARENNQSANGENELLGYIVADPLVASRDRSLAGAGFTRGKTEVTPVSNRSGSFFLTYSSGTNNAVIKGTIRETHVQFAEESAGVPVPLPDALLKNTTYREYGSRVAEKGFIRNETRINVTPGRETVDLAYADPKNRILYIHAVILDGTVTMIEGDNPDDPLATAVPVIALAGILLISAGIWYLARHRPADHPASTDTVRAPEPPKTPRETAWLLLDEAERDAARGIWPDAYRKTGRAIRIFLSHESGHGDELTSGELEARIGISAGSWEKIRWILDR
ncbi:MAG: hypothetical protein NTW33_02365, partial [Methanoregula sp.]|nr:hypothetical protein [Methanoregula sp.]